MLTEENNNYNQLELFKDLASFLNWRSSCKVSSIGFVPTMGALHGGHLKLVTESIAVNDLTVVSIFVNPKQFSPGEDLDSYPKTLAKDIELLKKLPGKIIVFAPQQKDIYPSGFSFYISETKISKILCGQTRENFYSGICTVLMRLFNLVNPNNVYFGQKDILQCAVVNKMIIEFGLNIKFNIVSTERDENGLALSSRNKFLSPDELVKSAIIYQVLLEAKKKYINGNEASKIVLNAKQQLASQGFIVQYLDFRQWPDFELINQRKVGRTVVLAIAVLFNKIRLIDNLWFNDE